MGLNSQHVRRVPLLTREMKGSTHRPGITRTSGETASAASMSLSGDGGGGTWLSEEIEQRSPWRRLSNLLLGRSESHHRLSAPQSRKKVML